MGVCDIFSTQGQCCCQCKYYSIESNKWVCICHVDAGYSAVPIKTVENGVVKDSEHGIGCDFFELKENQEVKND